MGVDVQQMAKDIQRIIASGAADCPVYCGEPPRDSDGAISVEPPYIAYTYQPNASTGEDETLSISLFIDVWALNQYNSAFLIAAQLDDALNGTVYDMPSGVFFCDRDGAIMQRMDRDPADERIRRVTGQYVARFAPYMKD